MTEQEFYGEALPVMHSARQRILRLIGEYPGEIQSVSSRIKTPDSMKEKLRRHGLPQTADAALRELNDAVGIRVICSFPDDIYKIAEWLGEQSELHIMARKDYIAYPKPNGYRGYHLIVMLEGGEETGVTAEIQLRTLALDFWASLEHKMKYKKQIRQEALIRGELKRCADEIASLDLSMQAIRDLLKEEPATP